MKKIYTLCIAAFILFLCSINSKASVIIINVEDFEFDPADFTVVIGDTIMWVWNNTTKSHTTTSTNIPARAKSWDEQINQSSLTFSYVPNVLGSYDYECTIHSASGMKGHFTVIGTTGISTSLLAILTLASNNPATQELKLIYSIPKNTLLNIKMYNIIGNTVCTFVSESQNAGLYTQTFAIPNISDGIYVITLETKDSILYKKIFIQ